MLIKAITLYRLGSVSDFLFAFCSLINIDEAPVRHFKTKWYNSYTHSLKKETRNLEPKWRKTNLEVFRIAGNTVCSAIDRL